MIAITIGMTSSGDVDPVETLGADWGAGVSAAGDPGDPDAAMASPALSELVGSPVAGSAEVGTIAVAPGPAVGPPGTMPGDVDGRGVEPGAGDRVGAGPFVGFGDGFGVAVGGMPKIAVVVTGVMRPISQVSLFPEQYPVQPRKSAPSPSAVSTMLVPNDHCPVHGVYCSPQSMPIGVL